MAMGAFCVGSACFGMMMGLTFPKLDAANEALVIKQSMSVTLAMFVPMGALALAGVACWLGSMLSPEAMLLLPTALLVILAVLCWLWLENRGPALLKRL